MTDKTFSIGIIMDGNRRWAKAKGLLSLEGHRAGYNKTREILDWAKDAGVTHLTVYAFSTENWNRAADEVGYLMDIFRQMIKANTKEAIEKGIRMIFIGQRERFEKDIQEAMEDSERRTKDCESFTFCIALSYGGRAEIVDAIHRIPEDKRATITEEEFSQLLWSREVPDPDLIIRTSGEERLSNFLPWQSVYSELVFIKTHWPELTREEFEHVLETYRARERRLGK